MYTNSPEQLTLVNIIAEEAYVEVGKKLQKPADTIHKSDSCVYITRRVVSKLREHDFPAIPVGTFDEIGFIGGEVPLYYHRFVNVGNGWIIDPGWQFYLEKSIPRYKQLLAKYKIYGSLPPKVLIAKIPEFDDLLVKSGVNIRHLPSWENKTYQVEEIRSC